MAVPRNRVSNARKNWRRAHDAKQPRTVRQCPQCQKALLPHRACAGCGWWYGKAAEATETAE